MPSVNIVRKSPGAKRRVYCVYSKSASTPSGNPACSLPIGFDLAFAMPQQRRHVAGVDQRDFVPLRRPARPART